MVQQCAGCQLPIADKFLLKVLDRVWHVNCVKCCECKCTLSEKCFSREGRLFCRKDFYRRYGTKCSGCTQGISPNDMVRRARNYVFHVDCFICSVCKRQIATGDELYYIGNCTFICKEDFYHTNFARAESEKDLAFRLDDDLEAALGGKRRGPRTTIKAKQLDALKSTFAATPKPTRSIREKLAQETGLNMRVIQVWFQNRRSKERRLKQQGATQQSSSQNRSSRSHRKSRTNRLDSGDSLDENQSLNTSHLHDFQPQDISSQVPQSPSQYVHSGPQPYNNNSFYSKTDSISEVMTSMSTGNDIASPGYGGQTLVVSSLHSNSSPSSTLNSSEHFSHRLNSKIGSSQSSNALINHTSTEVW